MMLSGEELPLVSKRSGKSTTLPTDIKVEGDSFAIEDVEDENLHQEEQQKDDFPAPYR
jgi:hypothetical protein